MGCKKILTSTQPGEASLRKPALRTNTPSKDSEFGKEKGKGKGAYLA
jgi:hypothetical protein